MFFETFFVIGISEGVFFIKLLGENGIDGYRADLKF